MQAVKEYLVFAVVVLGLALAASGAEGKTVTVTVGGVTYTLTAAPLSYTANGPLLQAQPWWANEPLAFAISGELQYSLGDLEGGNGSTPGIPSALLAYGLEDGDVSITYWDGTEVVNCPEGCPSEDGTFVYVTSQSSAAPVPTLSQWGLLLLVALMGPMGIVAVHRVRRA